MNKNKTLNLYDDAKKQCTIICNIDFNEDYDEIKLCKEIEAFIGNKKYIKRAYTHIDYEED